MSAPLLFDGAGVSLTPGAPPIDAFDLREWPACRVVQDPSAPPAETVSLILVLGDDGNLGLSQTAVAYAVAALDRGGAAAIHARDDDAAIVAGAAICLLLGGGHA